MSRLFFTVLLCIPCSGTWGDISAEYTKDIRPLLKKYCLDCHSTEKKKGELDLERFASLNTIKRHPKIWQQVVEQLNLDEMPPEKKPQPTLVEQTKLVGWVEAMLHEVAQENAGDPGPIVLRRLNNAEYTYTIRDLTGVSTLDPAHEFPTDGAAGEGFSNVGDALAMSPGLLSKYLAAAKSIAEHAVLLPDGIVFSPSTTQRDWTEERLASIRGFYRNRSSAGGGTSVNLQGIKFDTNADGRLPLKEYLTASLDPDPSKNKGLSPVYMKTLLSTLQGNKPSPLLDPIRERWRKAKPENVPELVDLISRWQKALWKFNSVGHIGKANGPKKWQTPVTPLQNRQEIRYKIPTGSPNQDVVFYIQVSDAGDGSKDDVVVLEKPRFTAKGKPDLLLRNLRSLSLGFERLRNQSLSQTAHYLAAAYKIRKGNEAPKNDLDPKILQAWLNLLGSEIAGPVKIENYLTRLKENIHGYNFVKAWDIPDVKDLSLVGNASDNDVKIPGDLRGHKIVVHPRPERWIATGWKSPLDGQVDLLAQVRDAHSSCGNGIHWSLEWRRGTQHRVLQSANNDLGKKADTTPINDFTVKKGDLISLVIDARDKNHYCDLTEINLSIAEKAGAQRIWSLTEDCADSLAAGNPHPDRFGNKDIWHFYTGFPAKKKPAFEIPSGSTLAQWLKAKDEPQARKLAEHLQGLFKQPPTSPPSDADADLLARLSAPSSPLFAHLGLEDFGHKPIAPEKSGTYGLDPGRFGTQSDKFPADADSLCLIAPAILEIRAPSSWLAGRELVMHAAIHPRVGEEGSVQVQALETRPKDDSGLILSQTREKNNPGPWTSSGSKVLHDMPILVKDGSRARARFEQAFNEFREVFPAALCYTKIVPVDEVVTLTLFYREDDHFRRLMLHPNQAKQLDRYWDELHFVSQDAFKLVDAFEQIWQFATQDADPKVFEPLRQPIKDRAEAFRKIQLESEPKHIEAVLGWARKAYRRPLTDQEGNELRGLYKTLREKELPHEAAIRLLLARVFVSPAFLYRAETPGPGTEPGPVNPWEFATRLSYFLWSSTPDQELQKTAEAGKLRDPEVILAQTRRMLQDPRVRQLAIEFGCQWLHIRAFDEMDEKSESVYPEFAGMRGAMYEESIRFFTELFQQNDSILRLLQSDHTFLNEALATHYGIPNVKGETWRKVDGVQAFSRGGVLTQASVLSKQAGASRTSPILRGNWVSEVLLGEKLPRPPKDVPPLPDEIPTDLTERQLTERHAKDPACARCHKRIDPIGFALENFDAIGRYRTQDAGKHPINTQTTLMNGQEIKGLDGLRNYLLETKRDVFIRQFCRKLLGFSLGRPVQLSDEPLLDEMLEKLKQNEYRVHTAIETIVRSPPFRNIRGRDKN